MHGQWGISQMPSTADCRLLERSKRPGDVAVLRLRVRLSLRFLSLLQLRDSEAMSGTGRRQTTGLERTPVEAGAVVVVALADDFAAANDDTAMTVVERRLGGLLETHGEVRIGAWRHCSFNCFGFRSLSEDCAVESLLLSAKSSCY